MTLKRDYTLTARRAISSASTHLLEASKALQYGVLLDDFKGVRLGAEALEKQLLGKAEALMRGEAGEDILFAIPVGEDVVQVSWGGLGYKVSWGGTGVICGKDIPTVVFHVVNEMDKFLKEDLKRRQVIR